MLRRILVGGGALLSTFMLGGYVDRHDGFPFVALRNLKSSFHGRPESRYEFDQTGILTSDSGKKLVPCPEQTDRTAVLLVIGQSNAGNHGGQRFRSEHSDKVLNFYAGQCFIAMSPLLGSDGTNGEHWTELGNLLLERGTFDQVVLAPTAISGSEVSRWTPKGDLNRVMLGTVNQLRQHNYRVTHSLWTQGEIDYVKQTSTDNYRADFSAMVQSLRGSQMMSPIYVSIASKCLEQSNGGTLSHTLDNPVVRAQRMLPDEQAGIRSGIDTDALLDDLDRFDDCHFGYSGQMKAAAAWADVLSEGLR